MRKSYLYVVAWLIACIFSISAFAQNVTLTGSIKNNFHERNITSSFSFNKRH